MPYCFFKGGAQHIDLVEPNKTGREEISALFSKEDKSRYTLHPCMMEEYHTDKKYDFIIAEGFIQHLSNWKELLAIIKSFAKTDTLVVTTCVDEIGLYVETMKRFVAWQLIREIEDYDGKVKRLVEVFADMPKKLPGMTRTVKDWVEDQLLNEAFLCLDPMNMYDAICEFQDGYDVMGASQNIFTDYSWFKDSDYNYIEEYKRQYDMRKHIFLVAGEIEEKNRTIEQNDYLEKAVTRANEIARKQEQGIEGYTLRDLLREVENVTEAADNGKITMFNEELSEIIESLSERKQVDFLKYDIFNTLFGKSAQYICFAHK